MLTAGKAVANEPNSGEPSEEDTLSLYDFPEFSIIESPSRLFDNVPGSVEMIDRETLESINHLNNNEVFRQISGMNAVDEEGVGLRANIGMRGLDPARSRYVLVLEDGVPVALAPYGEPEMYYTPGMDRMRGVEVIKGSGSILYGPQTIGGVVNYLTHEPPAYTSGEVNLGGGSGALYHLQGRIGTAISENTRMSLSFNHKQADELGTLGFDIYDINSRFRFDLNDRNRLRIKLSFYNENSNATYIGLTQPMFDNGEYYTQMAPDDRLQIRRYAFSARHTFNWTDNTRLNTTYYAYTTTRNWQRQDFAYNRFDDDGNPVAPPENYTGVMWGDASVAGGAVYMQNSTGNRNRTFEVTGVEPRLTHEYNLAGMQHALETGVRFHYEQAAEQRINGSHKSSPSGVLRNDELRTGRAFSSFAQHKSEITESLTLTYGVRTEWFDYDRNIRRGRFEIDGETVTKDTSLQKGSRVFEVLPGAGVNYRIIPNLNLFTGVHRGFSPPRVKDAITSEGTAMELDAERSWNFEAGLRTELFSALYLEATAFLMDFENQIIPVAEYTGASGVGLINAGETRHQGVELSARYRIDDMLDNRLGLVLSGNVTRLQSFYTGDRTIASENINGNRTPYSPEWLANSRIRFVILQQWEAGIAYHFTGSQYADELNLESPTANGQQGLIPAYSLIDVNGAWNIPGWNTKLTVSVKNLLDERYIASRRPQGIKPGMPRTFTASAKYSF